MAANQEIIDIERRIAEAISASALEAYNRGCTGIQIRFVQDGKILVQCYFPDGVEGSVSEMTFADYLNAAARLIIKAKRRFPR
jgi:hypothetical protein